MVSVDIGIVGLAKSGRTTIFNALTKGQADIEDSSPHLGTAKVPEPRLKTLADMLQPRKVVPAEVRYIDIGASVKGLTEEKAISGQSLAQLSNVDALINVVRAFPDESIPHVEGSLDVNRDTAAMGLELSFSDLAIIERRLERIELALKGAKQVERQGLLREQEMLTRIRAELENEVPIRELELTADEARAITSYQFLTAEPLLIVVNIGEEQLPQTTSIEDELKPYSSRPKCSVTALCGKLEMELTQLDRKSVV